MATFISHSPAETQELGASWGRTVTCGTVIAISGDLGAGKTQLVKGLAQGLGITARVHSPTFALLNVYPGGRLLLFHLDLYRLDSLEQFLAAGLEEYLTPAGVTVIEWAERLEESAVGGVAHEDRRREERLPVPAERLLRVGIETLSEMQRKITYEGPGA